MKCLREGKFSKQSQDEVIHSLDMMHRMKRNALDEVEAGSLRIEGKHQSLSKKQRNSGYGAQSKEAQVKPVVQPKQSQVCKLGGCGKHANPGFDFCCLEHGQEYNRQQMPKKQCMLSSCSNAVVEGYDFCCREHGEQMLAMMKKCVLPSCSNVASTGFDFCCKEHEQAYNEQQMPKKQCMLPSCSKAVIDGFDFCCRAHGEQMLAMMNRKKCELPSCSNVAVEGFDFCCREHGEQMLEMMNQSNSNFNSNK